MTGARPRSPPTPPSPVRRWPRRLLREAPERLGRLDVVGPAGTGKSVLLDALADVMERAGHTVLRELPDRSRRRRRGAALLVDDAHRLDPGRAGAARGAGRGRGRRARGRAPAVAPPGPACPRSVRRWRCGGRRSSSTCSTAAGCRPGRRACSRAGVREPPDAGRRLRAGRRPAASPGSSTGCSPRWSSRAGADRDAVALGPGPPARRPAGPARATRVHRLPDGVRDLLLRPRARCPARGRGAGAAARAGRRRRPGRARRAGRGGAGRGPAHRGGRADPAGLGRGAGPHPARARGSRCAGRWPSSSSTAAATSSPPPAGCSAPGCPAPGWRASSPRRPTRRCAPASPAPASCSRRPSARAHRPWSWPPAAPRPRSLRAISTSRSPRPTRCCPPPGQVPTADLAQAGTVAAAVLARRGMLARSAALYRLLGARMGLGAGGARADRHRRAGRGAGGARRVRLAAPAPDAARRGRGADGARASTTRWPVRRPPRCPS